MDDNETVFNSPEKAKKTREETAKYFQGGTDYNAKIKNFFGVGDAAASEAIKRKRQSVNQNGQ